LLLLLSFAVRHKEMALQNPQCGRSRSARRPEIHLNAA
jgi:hypothetical protein